MAWTNTGGGDHDGANWTPVKKLEIAGNHYNVGIFTVESGYTLYVKAYNGSSFGNVSVRAKNIVVNGDIIGDYRGYRGGNGGKGSQGASGNGDNVSASGAGTVGEADNTARKASGGGARAGVNYGTADPKYLLHRYHKGSAGVNGSNGGYYKANGGNGDTSVDETLQMGAGGGGASGGTGGGGFGHSFNVGGGGGGGGGAGSEGGAYIRLYGYQEITVTGKIYMRGGNSIAGNGGDGGYPVSRYVGGVAGSAGSASASGSSSGGSYGCGLMHTPGEPDSSIRGGNGGYGGDGAGGGILLKCYRSDGWTIAGANLRVDSVGSGGGGTVKIFYTGVNPSSDATITSGRTYTEDFGDGIDPPTDFFATKSDTADTIDLKWTDNSGGQLTWYIERKINERAWETIVSGQAAGTTTYTDSTATEDAYYYYRVRGYFGTTPIFPRKWDLLDEGFTNLDDWTNIDMNGGETVISPAGQLYQDATPLSIWQATAGINQDIGSMPAAGFTVEFKVYIDSVVGRDNEGSYLSYLFASDVLRLFAFISEDGFEIVTGGGGYEVYSTGMVENSWQTWRIGYNYVTKVCEVYLDHELEHSSTVNAPGTYTDGLVQLLAYGDNPYAKAHTDYIKLATGVHDPTEKIYAFYTDYAYSNLVDTTADTKLIGFSGKEFFSLEPNTIHGIWTPLRVYNQGTLQTTISGTRVKCSGTGTLWGSATGQEANIAVGDILYAPLTSGTGKTLDYDSKFPLIIVSGTGKIVVSGSVPTLVTGTNYVISKVMSEGEFADYCPYNLNLYIAKFSDYPVRYDMTNVKPVGCAIPSSAITGAVADTDGALTESKTYKYIVTFVYGTYGESNGNETAKSITLGAGEDAVDLSGIPKGDQFVTARNIYRTQADGTTYTYVAQIADNTTTVYADKIADATIVSNTALPTINDVPLKLLTIAEKNTRMFGGGNYEYPYTLYYTPANKPYAWDSSYSTNRDGLGKIVKIYNAFEAIVILFERGLEMVDVSNATPSNWTFEKIPSNVGLAGNQASCFGNKGIFFLGLKNEIPEIHFLHRGSDTVVNATFDNIVPDSLSEKIDTFMGEININAIHNSRLFFYDNKLYASVPHKDSIQPNKTAIYDFRRDAFSVTQKGYTAFTVSVGKFVGGTYDDNYTHQLEHGYTESDGSDITMVNQGGYMSFEKADITKDFELIRVRLEGVSGIMNVRWDIDHENISGSYDFDMADGNVFERYFPEEATGKSIRIKFSCTNSVQTKVVDYEIGFQTYEFGS